MLFRSDRVKGRLDDEDDINAVQKGIDAEKIKIRRNMPLRVTIERDNNEDKEHLWIEEVVDKEGNSLSKQFFSLQVQSMSEAENFWLDSGLFSLKTNMSNDQ